MHAGGLPSNPREKFVQLEAYGLDNLGHTAAVKALYQHGAVGRLSDR